MRFYWIRKLFGKNIKLVEKKPERMVRIFLAMQTKTDKTMYRLYVEMQETDIILSHSQIIKLLTKEQYIEFTQTEALMFLVPYKKIYGKYDIKKLDGRRLNADIFNVKNGIIKF